MIIKNRVCRNGKVDPIAAVVIGVVVLIFLLLIMFILVSSSGWSVDGISINDESTSNGDIATNVAALDYLIGQIPSFLVAKTNEWGAFIITLSMFLLLFITFGDIISTFGTFERWVGWLAGFLMAVIAANLKFVIAVLAFFVGVLSILGGLAVIIGIGTAFVAFLATNFGIRALAPWMMRRKAMHQAHKFDMATQKGAKQASSAVKAFRQMGKELEKS